MGRLAWLSAVLPHVLIYPEDAHPIQMGERGPVIGAVEEGVEDCPQTLLIGAGKSVDTNVQASRKPHDQQVNQSADSVITQFPGLGAVGAVPPSRATRAAASVMVKVPAPAAPANAKPISAVRQIVSATRLTLGRTVGSSFGQTERSNCHRVPARTPTCCATPNQALRSATHSKTRRAPFTSRITHFI